MNARMNARDPGLFAQGCCSAATIPTGLERRPGTVEPNALKYLIDGLRKAGLPGSA
jgi:hypothetical protein